MKWQDKRVLVTGAGGFIGSHLVDELLGKGADVTAFVHYNARNDWGMLEVQYDANTPHLTVIAGDVTDSLFVKKPSAKKSTCSISPHSSASPIPMWHRNPMSIPISKAHSM